MTNKTDGDHALLRDSLYGTTSEPTYAGALSFMRRKYTRDLEGVDLVVSGVPLDTATTNRPGARFGPRAIRAASTVMAFERPYAMEFDPFDKLAVVDYGDCFFDFGRPETVPSAIQEHASGIINQGPGLLSLGGDHFVAYPLIKAHAEKHGAPLVGGSFRHRCMVRTDKPRNLAASRSVTNGSTPLPKPCPSRAGECSKDISASIG